MRVILFTQVNTPASSSSLIATATEERAHLATAAIFS